VLELVAAPEDLLYLDNTFVGRGPSRLVSAGAGNHVVKIVRGEVEISGQVAATAGKRVRVSLELPARVPTKP
jgi:hypothetical protein